MKIKSKKIFEWVWQICQDCVICLSVKRVVGTHIFHIIYLYCILRRRNVNQQFHNYFDITADFPVKCFPFLLLLFDRLLWLLQHTFDGGFCFPLLLFSSPFLQFHSFGTHRNMDQPIFSHLRFHLGFYFLSIFGWFCIASVCYFFSQYFIMTTWTGA